jgi:hypothetical protein
VQQSWKKNRNPTEVKQVLETNVEQHQSDNIFHRQSLLANVAGKR